MTLVMESPGNLLATSWKVLEISRQWCTCSFWFQMDMYLQRKIAITVATRYIFWTAGMKYAPDPTAGAYSTPQLSLLLIVAIFKHCRVMTGSWKNAFRVLESPGIYCNKRVWTLEISIASYDALCHMPPQLPAMQLLSFYFGTAQNLTPCGCLSMYSWQQLHCYLFCMSFIIFLYIYHP